MIGPNTLKGGSMRVYDVTCLAFLRYVAYVDTRGRCEAFLKRKE